MKAFGVFKGGGVKGLAHIGAYKAAIEHGVQFVGVAGTSAGAIIAALIAAGYKPDELYTDKQGQQPAGAFSESFLQFFDPALWKDFQQCSEALQKPDRSPLALCLLLWNLCQPYLPSKVRAGCYLIILTLSGLLVVMPVMLLMYAGSVIKVFGGFVLVGVVVCMAGTLQTVSRLMRTDNALCQSFSRLLDQLLIHQGIFVSTEFCVWLDKLLRAKVKGTGPNGEVLFKDLSDAVPLKVVAADLTNARVTVLSKADTPDLAVVDAVAASFSIPLFFHPKQIDKQVFVDGGMLSNTPAWALDDERAQAGIAVPTLVFKLQERTNITFPPSASLRPFFRLKKFVEQIFVTLFQGGETLQYRQVGNLHMIPLQVNIPTLDLDLTPDQQRGLYSDGFRFTTEYLSQIVGASNSDRIEQEVLPFIHDTMLNTMELRDRHLRVGVLLRICKNASAPIEQQRHTLRVCHSHNMDNDADDQLELDMGAGGSGKCWRERKAV